MLEHQAIRASSSFRVRPELVAFASRICQYASQKALGSKARCINAWGSHEYRNIFLRHVVERVRRIPSIGPIVGASAGKDDRCPGIGAHPREDLLWQAY